MTMSTTIWLVCCDTDTSVRLTDAEMTSVARTLRSYRITALYATETPAATRLAAHLAPVVGVQPISLSPGTDLRECITRVATEQQHQLLALVTEAARIQTLLCQLLGLSPAQAAVIRQQCGALNRIIVEPHRTVVAGVNDLCHLHA